MKPAFVINRPRVLLRLAETNTTLSDLARAADLHPSHLGRLVRGVHPATARTRRKLMGAPALAGLSFRELFRPAESEVAAE